jgi:TIR domain
MLRTLWRTKRAGTSKNLDDLVFLSYSRSDKEKVDILYRQLHNAGLNLWMDQPPFPFEKRGIPPGADWDNVIREKLREASWVFVCFSSNAIDKEGYFQREIRLVLDRMNNLPPGKDWFVPVLLEKCSPRDIRIDAVNLNSRQHYELYRNGFEGLVDLVKGAGRALSSGISAERQAASSVVDELLLDDQEFFRSQRSIH